MAPPAAAWLADAQAELLGFPELRVLPAHDRLGVYDHGNYLALERIADHKVHPRTRRAAPAALAHRCAAPRYWRRAHWNGRWCSPATTVRASCWPRRYGATSTASPCAPARGWSC